MQIEMFSLAYLKEYGGSSSEEEEFNGFDLMNGTEERFPLTQTVFRENCHSTETTSSCSSLFAVENTDENLGQSGFDKSYKSDSSCSFSEERPPRTYKKKTKKELRRENSAKKRRVSHPVILKNCECLKNCNGNLIRDDRVQFHANFWSLDNIGQGNLIRKRRNWQNDFHIRVIYPVQVEILL